MQTISPVRGYSLAATVLPLVGLSRLSSGSSVQSVDMFTATAADAAVLVVMLGFYLLIGRFCGASSRADRLNRIAHIALTIGILLVVLASELLYRRTGELLDLDIVRFAVSNLGDVQGAVSSVLGWHDLVIVLVGLALAGVMLPAFSSRLIRGMQAAVLLFPWCALGASAAFDAWAFDRSPVVPSVGMYHGRYANWNSDHEDWLSSQQAGWRRGLLTGIVADKTMTRFEQLAIGRSQAEAAGYTLPEKISSPKAPYNVLFIVLESTRHNLVGAYQAQESRKSITPFVDRLAKEGWLVERAYTTIPHTSKALVGIYCGTFARFSPLVSESEPGGLPFSCLPKLLASVGYTTAHFQTAPAQFENRTGLLTNLGFETQVTQSSFSEKNWQRFGYIAMDDRAMVRPAVSWMQQQQRSGKPFLASVLTVLTHHPYASPVSNRPISDQASAFESFVDALGYTDQVVAELFAEMGKAGLLENTLVVVTGDHGEAFSEHGLITHNGVSFEEGMRVPMILWGRMLGAPRTVAGLRQHLDLVPTVFDLLGIAPEGRLPGISLAKEVGHQEIITSCFYNDYCLDHYEDGGSKTSYFYGKRPSQVFEVLSDPYERIDLAPNLDRELMHERLRRAFLLRMSFQDLYDRSSSRTDLLKALH